MRCKNCGSENNDNLYICQNCGSPLYDEDAPVTEDDGATKMFTPPVVGNGYDEAQHIPSGNTPTPEEDEEKNKKQLIIIIVLAVILVAIIAAIAGTAIHNRKVNDPSTSAVSVSDESTSVTTTEKVEESTTETTTEKETTTTTTTTTEAAKKQYTISVGTNDSGWAEGGGTFYEGDSVTVYCGADDGYTFMGWYKDGSKVSNSTKYTFKANGDVYLEARFEAEEAPSEDTSEGDGIEVIDGGDIG